MTPVKLILLAIGLSMDAFAVSVCKGLASMHSTVKNCVKCGLWCGAFQMLMPIIGFYLGNLFADAIEAIDHWIAFGLLSLIGINMLREGISQEEGAQNPDCSVRAMFVMALATSVDAMAAGISLAMTGSVNIMTASCTIGLITFLFSAFGVKIGNVFGSWLEHKAEIAGGVVLILLAINILLEHMEVIA